MVRKRIVKKRISKKPKTVKSEGIEEDYHHKHSKGLMKKVAIAKKEKKAVLPVKEDSFDIKKITNEMRARLHSQAPSIENDSMEPNPNLEKDKEEIYKSGQKLPSAKDSKFIKTNIPGLDTLLVDGIPRGAAVLVCGGTGSGKTILNLQLIANACLEGKKCLCLTLEESEDRLIDHMADFKWDAKKWVDNKQLMFIRLNPFDIMRNVDALLAKEKGELLIDVKPVILPSGFIPDIIIFDSLTAIAAAFIGRQDTYRIYIEKLFRYFEEIGSTNFLISETDQVPKKFSPTGTEEFLADGVLILYSIQRRNMRERAFEVLKMRGVAHQRKIVAMRIIKGSGIEIFPNQEVMVEIEK
jgi:KaiC/GvpD/RAD55 family RecA-like ATPase